jgi:hypothetical protein
MHDQFYLLLILPMAQMCALGTQLVVDIGSRTIAFRDHHG